MKEMQRTISVIIVLFLIFTINAQSQNDYKPQNIADYIKDSRIKQLIDSAFSVYNSDFEKANVILDYATQIATEDKLFCELINCYYTKGIIETNLIKYNLALRSFQTALLFIENIEDNKISKNFELTLFYSLGNTFSDLKLLPQALEYYQKAEQVSLEIGESEFNQRLHSSFASIYHDLGDFSKSNRILFDLLKEPYEDTSIFASSIYFNICNNFFNLYLFDSIPYYAKLGLKYSKAREDTKHKEDLLSILGSAYYEVGDYHLSEQILDSALLIAKKKQRNKLLLFLNLAKGKLKLKLEDIKQAEDYFIKAYKGAIELKLLHIQKEISQELSMLYTLRGNYQEALNYQQRYVYLIDTLNILINKPKVNAIIANSEYQIMKQKLQYEYEKEKTEIEYKMKQYIMKSIIAILLLFIAIFFSLILFYKQKKKYRFTIVDKENIDIELKKLEKIMTTNALSKIRMTEGIQDSVRNLSKLKMHLNNKNIKILDTSIRQLLNILNNDENIGFEFYFNRVHPNFYANLNKEFPKLSQSELKLCAFIRLNLSSKQISSILNITPDSVKTSRTRLRKNLNISNSDINLFKFLSGF